jgi:hypothetical protein
VPKRPTSASLWGTLTRLLGERTRLVVTTHGAIAMSRAGPSKLLCAAAPSRTLGLPRGSRKPLGSAGRIPERSGRMNAMNDGIPRPRLAL